MCPVQFGVISSPSEEICDAQEWQFHSATSQNLSRHWIIPAAKKPYFMRVSRVPV